jgi:hypothetical protein
MKSFIAAGALGCALLLAPIACAPAQAFPHGGHGGMAFHGMASRPGFFPHGRPFFAHHAHPFFFRHHRFRNFAFIGFPYYDTYDYGYGYSCGWLHRRAIYTGSRYWRYRYYQCIGY